MSIYEFDTENQAKAYANKMMKLVMSKESNKSTTCSSFRIDDILLNTRKNSSIECNNGKVKVKTPFPVINNKLTSSIYDYFPTMIPKSNQNADFLPLFYHGISFIFLKFISNLN